MYYVQHSNTTLIQALKGITEFWKLIDGDYEHKDLHCLILSKLVSLFSVILYPVHSISYIVI